MDTKLQKKIDQLTQLKVLFESQALTRQEYEIEKAKILAVENGIHLLRFWHELYQDDLITEAEFQEKKDGLLKKETKVEFISDNEISEEKPEPDISTTQTKQEIAADLNIENPAKAKPSKKPFTIILVAALIIGLLGIITFLGYKMTIQQTNPESEINNTAIAEEVNPVPEKVRPLKENETESINSAPMQNDIKGVIRDLISAEDERDFDLIYSFYSSNLRRYWDVNYPTKDELRERYYHSWKTLQSSRNEIVRIDLVDLQTYDLHTTFKYVTKNDDYRSVNSIVRFVFDDNGKIVECYGL